MSTHRYKQEAAGLHGRLRVANIEHDSLQDEIARLRTQRDKLLIACEDEQTALEVWASDPALPADVKEGVGISLDKIRKAIRAAEEDDDGRR